MSVSRRDKIKITRRYVADKYLYMSYCTVHLRKTLFCFYQVSDILSVLDNDMNSTISSVYRRQVDPARLSIRVKKSPYHIHDDGDWDSVRFDDALCDGNQTLHLYILFMV